MQHLHLSIKEVAPPCQTVACPAAENHSENYMMPIKVNVRHVSGSARFARKKDTLCKQLTMLTRRRGSSQGMGLLKVEILYAKIFRRLEENWYTYLSQELMYHTSFKTNAYKKCSIPSFQQFVKRDNVMPIYQWVKWFHMWLFYLFLPWVCLSYTWLSIKTNREYLDSS